MRCLQQRGLGHQGIAADGTTDEHVAAMSSMLRVRAAARQAREHQHILEIRRADHGRVMRTAPTFTPRSG